MTFQALEDAKKSEEETRVEEVFFMYRLYNVVFLNKLTGDPELALLFVELVWRKSKRKERENALESRCTERMGGKVNGKLKEEEEEEERGNKRIKDLFEEIRTRLRRSRRIQRQN